MPKLIRAWAISLCLAASMACATPPERTPVTIPRDMSTPEQMVREIYTLPDPDFAAFTDPRRRPDHYTPRIVERAARKEHCYLEKYGMQEIEFNFIVPGQDYDISDLDIALVRMDSGVAEVRVRFNRFRQIVDPVEMNYLLKEGPTGWRIDDVLYEKTSLAKELLEPC